MHIRKSKINPKKPFPTIPSIELLDIGFNLHYDNTAETDIYYKDTNAHDYLPHNSTS